MPGAPPYDVLAVDNIDVIRHGLHLLPTTHPAVVRSVRTHASVDEVDLTAPPPDVTVLDYWLGREDVPSVEHIAPLKAWGTRVILYTNEEKPFPLVQAARAGIDGLCLKNDGLDALVAAIRSVGEGRVVYSSRLARALLDDEALRVRLTPAETSVLRGLSLGLTQAEIAQRQGSKPKTVSSQVERIREKFAGATGSTSMTSGRMVRLGLGLGLWDERVPDPGAPDRSSPDAGRAGDA